MAEVSASPYETVVDTLSNVASYVYISLTPEPLSPHFQAGGSWYGYNEDLTQILLFMTVLFLIDNLLVKRFLTEKSRYFTLHACANAVTCFGAWTDVVRAYTTDPYTVFEGPACSMVGNSATIALHLYHMIAFKVTAADLFHHFVFVGCLCGPAIPFKQVAGVSVNLSCFFLSGLPGGMDYVMLVLMYEGKITRATEKKWFSIINVYLRGPSMVVYTYLCWIALYNHTYNAPFPLALLVAVLHFFNGQYYSKQAVESAAVFFYREGLRKKEIEAASSSPSDGSPTTATAKGAVRAKQD